jgi:hypothetical protein
MAAHFAVPNLLLAHVIFSTILLCSATFGLVATAKLHSAEGIIIRLNELLRLKIRPRLSQIELSKIHQSLIYSWFVLSQKIVSSVNCSHSFLIKIEIQDCLLNPRFKIWLFLFFLFLFPIFSQQLTRWSVSSIGFVCMTQWTHWQR